MLFHYGCELHYLNPNGIQQLSIFVVLCDGFLGVEPNFVLWKNFFSPWLHRGRVGTGDNATFLPMDIGSVTIQLKNSRSAKYIYVPMPSSHSGWHKRWFYLHNDAACYRQILGVGPREK